MFAPLVSHANITPIPQFSTYGKLIQFESKVSFSSLNQQQSSIVQAFLKDWKFTNTSSGIRINLRHNSSLGPEEYKLNINQEIVVEYSTKTGLAWALHSLGQELSSSPRTAQIKDAPNSDFRCVMIDVARRYHSPSTLRNLIRSAQAGKVRYMQLHLTDDQNWMFPTTVFEGVDKNNTHKKPTYTRQELKELQEFAEARGVTLFPEIDLPGHNTLLVKHNPELFRIEGSESTNCIDFASEEVRTQINTLINEVAEVFPNAPYIHLGGDEAWYPNTDKDPDFIAATKRIGNNSTASEVFIDFIAEVSNQILKHGKTPIIWEGFHASEFAKENIPKEAIIVAWEGPYYPANKLIPDGYKVINAGWDPNYVVNHYPYDSFTLAPLERLYNRSQQKFGVVEWTFFQEREFEFPPSKNLLGSLMCWWEGHEWNAQKYLSPRIITFGANLWNPKSESNYSRYLPRLQKAQSNIKAQSFPFQIKSQQIKDMSIGQFENSAEVIIESNDRSMEFAVRLDGETPTSSDLTPSKRFSITSSSILTIQAFKNGIPIGETQFTPLHKITIVPNLALGCKVTTTTEGDPQFSASCITDGVADQLSAFWLAYPNPQEATIDLKSVQSISQIDVVAFWITGAVYKYKIFSSKDGKNWTEIVDASEQDKPSTSAGYSHRVPVQEAKFIKFQTIGTTMFPSTVTRINEIRVF